MENYTISKRKFTYISCIISPHYAEGAIEYIFMKWKCEFCDAEICAVTLKMRKCGFDKVLYDSIDSMRVKNFE